MKKTKLRMLAVAMVAIATVGVTKAQVTGVTASTTCVPSQGGEYAAQFHAHYTNGAAVWDLTNPIHDRFTSCDPVPPAGTGGSSTHTFGSGVKATVTTTQQLLSIRGSLSPKLAGSILTLLLARADTTENLLQSIADGKVQFSELQLDQRQALLNHPTREIAARAKELMESRGAAVVSNRQALVDQWLPVSKMKGDLPNGIAMFKKHCAACHKHGEMGVSIGPALTGMAVHPKEEILMNVLDPSRSVENNFRTYQILTTDGAVLTARLVGESANALRLINSQGKDVQVLRQDIEEMQSGAKSLMPEGFESQISQQEMADLLTFLNNRGRYTPLALSTSATLSGPKGLPGFRGNAGDKFEFKSYGTVEIEGVPIDFFPANRYRISHNRQ